MVEDMWRVKGRLTSEQKQNLVKPFTTQEVEEVIKDMTIEFDPWPDGFPVIFYKKFWGLVKWWIMQMMEAFHMGKMNLSRINYGLIVLLPKVKEVVNIKQFRPIYLLNVFYKLFTKVLATRLMEVAQDIVSDT
jgi:hypothetical protein